MVRSLVNCAVCDSNKYAVFLEPSQIVDDPKLLYGADSGLRGVQKLVRCLDCDLIYENPRLSDQAILSGYQSAENIGHDTQHHMRVRSFFKSLQRHRQFFPSPNLRVLDIGTAGGGFLEAAQTMGFDAHGLEPSTNLAEQGRKRGLKIHCGTIEKNEFDAGSFDLVTLWDVIEHLPRPKDALVECRRLLKPGGLIMVNFPDIGTFQARLAGKNFWWLLSVHLHHFSKKNMASLVEQNGFNVIRFSRHWQTLEFGYLEKMAAHLGVPFAALIEKFTPNVVKQMPFPYYASQTTLIAKSETYL